MEAFFNRGICAALENHIIAELERRLRAAEQWVPKEQRAVIEVSAQQLERNLLPQYPLSDWL